MKGAENQEPQSLKVLATQALAFLVTRFEECEKRMKEFERLSKAGDPAAIDAISEEFGLHEMQMTVDLYTRLRLDGHNFDKLPEIVAAVSRVEGVLAVFDADNEL